MKLHVGGTAKVEYGIIHFPSGDIHRWGMTAEEAQAWLREQCQFGDSRDLFGMISRELGSWEEVIV